MIKAIENELYKISKNDDYNDDSYTVEIKETGNYILVYKEELEELIELLTKAKYILSDEME